MKFFKKVPLAEYWFESDEDYFLFRDVFVKLKIRDGLVNNPKFLTTHVLNSYERPDIIASKLYNNPFLFWTLYLVNDIMDPKEWMMGSREHVRYIKEKYETPSQIHHYERLGQVADPTSAQILVTVNPFGTIDSDPDFDITDLTTYTPYTNAEHEERVNDSKRIIRAIRKEHMQGFLNDVEKKLRGENV